MKLLEERIRKDGVIRNGNILKVDSFLNHQLDVSLLDEIGKEFYRLFKDQNVTKILTIESSGIAIAVSTAREFGVPAVFAKKNRTKNIEGEVFSAAVESFTSGITYNNDDATCHLNILDAKTLKRMHTIDLQTNIAAWTSRRSASPRTAAS